MPRRPPPPPHALTSLSPLRILTQIITLQLLYYLCATTLILFTALTAGKPFTPDLVLSWRSLRGDTTVGWTLGLCWMGGSFCGYVTPCLSLALTQLYQRAIPLRPSEKKLMKCPVMHYIG